MPFKMALLGISHSLKVIFFMKASTTSGREQHRGGGSLYCAKKLGHSTLTRHEMLWYILKNYPVLQLLCSRTILHTYLY